MYKITKIKIMCGTKWDNLNLFRQILNKTLKFLSQRMAESLWVSANLQSDIPFLPWIYAVFNYTLLSLVFQYVCKL